MKVKNVFAVICSLLTGAVAGGAVIRKLENGILQDNLKKVDKFNGYYNLLNRWLSLKQEGKSIDKYFIDNEIKKIAIYGMGEIGARLYYELKDSEVELSYAIDSNSLAAYSELEVYNLEGKLPDAELIVVTAIFDFDEIESKLSEITNIKIVSLEDIVYYI